MLTGPDNHMHFKPLRESRLRSALSARDLVFAMPEGGPWDPLAPTRPDSCTSAAAADGAEPGQAKNGGDSPIAQSVIPGHIGAHKPIAIVCAGGEMPRARQLSPPGPPSTTPATEFRDRA